jgi:hypothetical protein
MSEPVNNTQRLGMTAEDFGWKVPVGLIAVVLVIGGLVYMNITENRTNTAFVDRSVLTETGPVGAKAMPATRPASNQ